MMSKYEFCTLGYQDGPRIIIYEKYYFHNYLLGLGLQELKKGQKSWARRNLRWEEKITLEAKSPSYKISSRITFINHHHPTHTPSRPSPSSSSSATPPSSAFIFFLSTHASPPLLILTHGQPFFSRTHISPLFFSRTEPSSAHHHHYHAHHRQRSSPSSLHVAHIKVGIFLL